MLAWVGSYAIFCGEAIDIAMSNREKISPMTAYYLRKLIQANQSQLAWAYDAEAHSVNPDRALVNSVSARLKVISSPKVLEKLVTLHQSLMTSEQGESQQIQSLESQIYEMLGLQRQISLEIENQLTSKNLNYSPQKYGNLLSQLYETIRKIDSIMSPGVTLRYLKKTCPDSNWQPMKFFTGSVSSAQVDQRIFIPNHALEVYEQWADLFCSQCDSIVSEVANERRITPEGTKVTPENPQSVGSDWSNLQQLTKITSWVANTPSPWRSRDVLKLLNAVSSKSVQLIGAEQTRSYLLESCPADKWCHLFLITEMGSIKYSGNICELVTKTRLHQLKVWMEQFWQRCEAIRVESPT